MKRRFKVAGPLLLVAVGAVVTAAAVPGSTAVFHETKEVAGLRVVFGAEPEPALTEEMQFLRWRSGLWPTRKPTRTSKTLRRLSRAMAKNSALSGCGARAATRVSTKRSTSLPPKGSTNPS